MTEPIGWYSEDEPPEPPLGLGGALRAGGRLAVLFPVLIVMVALMLIVRGGERLVVGAARPWSSYFPQAFCALFLRVIGLRLTVRGTRMRQHGAVVCNHASWSDILVLNAPKRIFFVSKAEVASWPGIGAMARAVGTVFISRDRRLARAQVAQLRERLDLGHKLLFFPEGTSTDSRRVIPFKPTLFAAFYAESLRDEVWIQPATLIYHAPKGQDGRFYGWWGDMGFGAHFLKVMGARRQGRAEIVYHAPVRVADFADRKALAAHCEAEVKSGFGDLLIEG